MLFRSGGDVELVRQAAGVRSGSVGEQLTERFEALFQLVVGHRREVEAIRLRQDGFEVVGVLKPVDGFIFDDV